MAKKVSTERLVQTCEQQGVSFVEAEEEEVRGEWNWLAEDQVSDQGFKTKRACALNAIEVLNLQA